MDLVYSLKTKLIHLKPPCRVMGQNTEHGLDMPNS